MRREIVIVVKVVVGSDGFAERRGFVVLGDSMREGV